MSLYKRAGVWWYDFTIGDRRHRRSTKLRDKAAAAKVENRARETAVLGSPDRPVPTIEEASDQWFAARIAGRRAEKTTAQRLNIMLRLIGANTLVSRIDAPEIASAMQARRMETTRQGRLPTNSTVNRDLIDTTLRPVLTYAREVMKAPTHDIPWKALKLQEPPGRDRTFTEAELAAWRAALPEWHRPIFDFAARYGVRLREAFFPLDAIDVERGLVFLRARKNGRAHTLKLLPEDAAEMAARYGRARAAGLATAWFRERRGRLTAIHWRSFQAASRAALDAAGIEGARPVHDLRHHAATSLMRRTGDLPAVQKLLGHESITSTARYAHADDDHVFRALRHAYGTNGSEVDGKPAKMLEQKGESNDRTGT